MTLAPNTFHQGDALELAKALPNRFVNCIVTSPPYWGLRDYGTAQWVGGDPDCDHRQQLGGEGAASKIQNGSTGSQSIGYRHTCGKCGGQLVDRQLGLEETPEQYIAKLVSLFAELKRSLTDDGTLWLNLGDSYAAGGNGIGSGKQLTNVGSWMPPKRAPERLKPKDLVGIPWRVALALQADGWYLRSDIIWAKPNPMPESVKDRPTRAHEYIFLLSKSAKYYYNQDAIKQPAAQSSVERLSQDIENQTGSYRQPGKTNGPMKAVRFGGNKADGYSRRTYSGNEWKPSRRKEFRRDNSKRGQSMVPGKEGTHRPDRPDVSYDDIMVNRRSVWTVATKPYSDAHFAVFPPDLIEPCVLAGCPPDGVVLDPFMGSGTVAEVATKHNRQWLGFELNPDYIKLARKRLSKVQRALPAIFEGGAS